MRQGQDETDDSYLKQMKANTESLKLTGGEHIFMSPESMTTTGITTMAQEERMEIDKIIWVLLLLSSDKIRYGHRNK